MICISNFAEIYNTKFSEGTSGKGRRSTQLGKLRTFFNWHVLLQADFAAEQGGKVGITLNTNWGEPQEPENPAHQAASETWGRF